MLACPVLLLGLFLFHMWWTADHTRADGYGLFLLAGLAVLAGADGLGRRFGWHIFGRTDGSGSGVDADWLDGSDGSD